MKGTEHFKSVIQCYLENRASYDELFAETFRKENKSIAECVTYILSEVQKAVVRDFRTMKSTLWQYITMTRMT